MQGPPARSVNDFLPGVLVWDAHAGVFPSPEIDLNLLTAWREQGADYVSINVGFDVVSPQHTLSTIAAYRRWLLSEPERFVLAGGIADIEAAKHAGKLAVSFDIEGVNALDGNVNMVGVFHALGVRQMLFAYNLNNKAAGGCHDEDMGLTEFGRSVLREMNRVGLIVDASHTSLSTSLDLIAESSSPVIFSHSNPAAVWKHQRNISDDQIRACAARGGVIGLNGLGIFLGDNDTRMETLLRHLFHLLDRAGSAHVGLGFDYTPDVKIDLGAILRSRPDFWPAGQQYDTRSIGHAGPKTIGAIVDGLSTHGLKEFEIRGVLGENFKRVAAIAWGSAAGGRA